MAKKIVQQIASTKQFKAAQETKAELVKVMFKSVPPSADVEVDGIFYGNAGNSISVPAGLHNVKISLPGYGAWNKKVMLREGQSIKATLEEQADVKVKVEQQQKQE